MVEGGEFRSNPFTVVVETEVPKENKDILKEKDRDTSLRYTVKCQEQIHNSII